MQLMLMMLRFDWDTSDNVNAWSRVSGKKNQSWKRLEFRAVGVGVRVLSPLLMLETP